MCVACVLRCVGVAAEETLEDSFVTRLAEPTKVTLGFVFAGKTNATFCTLDSCDSLTYHLLMMN